MSKKEARRLIQESKQGCTVTEFLTLCQDMGTYFDEIQGTEYEEAYRALTRED